MTTPSKQDAPSKLVHTARIAVRWRDMDLNRHVNNVVYFRYFEQARIEWLDAALNALRDRSQGIVIANAFCNFIRPIAYPAELDVCLYAGAPGRSSFQFDYAIHPREDRSVTYADGYTRVVWVDRRSGRSAPLPEPLRALLG